MTRIAVPLCSIIAILVVALGCSNEAERLKRENETLKAYATPPPGAMDALLPAKPAPPVYQLRMMGMSMPFTGIISDLFEQDFENVMANFQAFKTEYIEVSKLVPEFASSFPIAPVDELEKALKNNNQGEIMAAYEGVGQVCRDCHVQNMVKVQQKYHWGDFQSITVNDPLTNEAVNWLQLMQYIDANMVGAFVDLQQGQIDNAKKQWYGFNTRYQTLKTTCGFCHDSERKYYVDSSSQALIDELSRMLNQQAVDPAKLEQVGMKIGNEICGKCHLVHVPAAYAKRQWEKLAEITQK